MTTHPQAQIRMAGFMNKQFMPSLSELDSTDSAEVMEHFGPEAPGLLNLYACRLEDLLIQQGQSLTSVRNELHVLQQERNRLYQALVFHTQGKELQEDRELEDWEIPY